MEMIKKVAGVGVILVAAAVLGVLSGNLVPWGGGGAGAPAPSFTGTSLEGETIELADLRGQVVVVDFWATWCPPCVEKLPEMVAMAEEYADEGVQFLGVSADKSESDLRRFLDRNRVNFPIIFEGASPILNTYGVSAIPTVVVIDREGNTIHRSHGTGVRDAIERALAQSDQPAEKAASEG